MSRFFSRDFSGTESSRHSAQSCRTLATVVADDWKYAEARALFLAPDVAPAEEVELKWTAPDIDGLVDLMCTKNGFAEDRIRNGAAKLIKARSVRDAPPLPSPFFLNPL